MPTIEEAIEWWGPRLRRALAAGQALPRTQLLYLRFEDLVADERERTLEQLLRFLQVGVEPQLTAFFDREVSADSAHIGRWRHEVEDGQCERISRRYEEILSALDLPR